MNKVNNIEKLYDYIRMLDADGYPKAFMKLYPFIAKLSNAKLINKKLKATIEFEKNNEK